MAAGIFHAYLAALVGSGCILCNQLHLSTDSFLDTAELLDEDLVDVAPAPVNVGTSTQSSRVSSESAIVRAQIVHFLEADLNEAAGAADAFACDEASRS
jgi:hypothetical protein